MARFFPLSLILAASFAGAAPAAAAQWPDLSRAADSHGEGRSDTALIVSVEHYPFVQPVPGALQNAGDWYQYFTKERGLEPSNVTVLRDGEATVEKMRQYLAATARASVPGGKLWFVFIGHGAPSLNGKGGALVGFDAQQDPDSISARSLGMAEALSTAAQGRQSDAVLVIDACFSGRVNSSESLLAGLQPLVSGMKAIEPMPRTTVFTAAKADEFAGPLLGEARPAFSYLLLGALRGWADQDGHGRVTVREAFDYVKEALRMTIKGRTQEPDLTTETPELVLAEANEKGPDLGAIFDAPPAPRPRMSAMGPGGGIIGHSREEEERQFAEYLARWDAAVAALKADRRYKYVELGDLVVDAKEYEGKRISTIGMPYLPFVAHVMEKNAFSIATSWTPRVAVGVSTPGLTRAQRRLLVDTADRRPHAFIVKGVLRRALSKADGPVMDYVIEDVEFSDFGSLPQGSTRLGQRTLSDSQ
jgi:hypothetical protein